MPKAIRADWNLAQALYLQGISYRHISERVGVTEAALRKRASRHRWHDLRTNSIVAVSQTGAEAAQRTLCERSRVVREALAGDLEESVHLLPKLKQTAQPRGFKLRQEAVGKLADNASKMFGWGGESKVTINQALFLDDVELKPVNPPQAAGQEQAMIEAPAESVNSS